MSGSRTRATRRSWAGPLLALALLGCGGPEHPRPDDGVLHAQDREAADAPPLRGLPVSAKVTAPATEPAIAAPAAGSEFDLGGEEIAEEVASQEVTAEAGAPPRDYEAEQEALRQAAEARRPPDDPSAPAWIWAPRRPARPPGESERPERKREDEVLRALRWLAAHQSLDGRWEPTGASAWCEGVRTEPAEAEIGSADHEVGTTALALLAFLGAGWGSRGDGEFRVTVTRGLGWLESAMDRDGYVRSRRGPYWMWGHALATLAFAQVADWPGEQRWVPAAGRMLEALSKSRGAGGIWRYGVTDGAADESLTLWAAMPLVLAQRHAADQGKRGRPALLPQDPDGLRAALAWVERSTHPESGRWREDQEAGWRPGLPGSGPAQFETHALALRALAGPGPGWVSVPTPAADRLAAVEPGWDPSAGRADACRLWLGTIACDAHRGAAWRRWETAQLAPLRWGISTVEDPCLGRGSFEPAGHLGNLLGRVGTTALACLALEVWYRYDRALGAR